MQIRTSAFVLSHFRFSDTYKLSMNTIGGHRKPWLNRYHILYFNLLDGITRTLSTSVLSGIIARGLLQFPILDLKLTGLSEPI